MRLAGYPLDAAPRERWATVGHLVEYPLAYPELTVRRNLQLSARMRGIDDVAEAVTAVIKEFALEEYAERRTRTLSLGNRQRLGLAAALQHDPSVIVLDEPTNALDPAGVIRLRESLPRMRPTRSARPDTPPPPHRSEPPLSAPWTRPPL